MTKLLFKGFIIVATFILIFCGHNRSSTNENKKENTQFNNESIFHLTEIGDNVWMTENLNVSQFSNGDEFFHATTMEEWVDAGKQKKAAWCYYDFNDDNESVHGKLYNLYAVKDKRGLAPEGWKIPTAEDFATLLDFAKSNCSDDLKSCLLENGKSGFNARFSGWVDEEGYFDGMNSGASFWSSTMANGWGRMLYIGSYDSGVLIDENSPEYGYSIRCIKE